MHLLPDNPPCDTCGKLATIHLRDTQTCKEHLYCEEHAPSLWPGKNAHLEIQRFRSPSNSPCSKLLAADEKSSEHQSFKADICDLRILGGEGASRYYLSKLTASDQFALWNDEFVDNMREYVIQETNGAAGSFPFDCNSINFMAPLLKQAYLKINSNNTQLTVKELAVVLLLHHPSWSDEQIAEQIPTTVKQLQRNADYKALKSLVGRARLA